MKRQELSQIYFLDRELRMWENRLKELREQSMVKAQSIDGMPFQNTGDVSDIVFQHISEIMELQAEIDVFRMNIERKKHEIELYIMTLDDSLLRQIIEYRCVQLKSWDQVAGLIGYSTTADSCRMYFNRKFPKKSK